MDPKQLLELIELIHAQKDVPKEAIFLGLEEALAAGVRKRLGVYKTVHAVIKAYMLGLIESDRIVPSEDSSLLWSRIKPHH